MVVYPCDIHKVSKLLTGKKGQLKKEVPSVAMMTNFGFGPTPPFVVCNLSFLKVIKPGGVISAVNIELFKCDSVPKMISGEC